MHNKTPYQDKWSAFFIYALKLRLCAIFLYIINLLNQGLVTGTSVEIKEKGWYQMPNKSPYWIYLEKIIEYSLKTKLFMKKWEDSNYFTQENKQVVNKLIILTKLPLVVFVFTLVWPSYLNILDFL
jgi:hypothetical protein